MTGRESVNIETSYMPHFCKVIVVFLWLFSFSACSRRQGDASGFWSNDSGITLSVLREDGDGSYYAVLWKEPRINAYGSCGGTLQNTSNIGEVRVRGCGHRFLYSRIRDTVSWRGQNLRRVSPEVYYGF